ncbi:MAG: NAD-dependent epimerase/dehydratase family protein [Bdellovibrionota bacterium]
MKHVGVLGGSRFIGYHLAQKLIKDGYKVTLFNRGITKAPTRLNLEHVLGDRNDPKSLEAFFSKKNYDAVVDLSGYSPKHVKPILERYRDQIGHYLFCSTSSVYRTPPPSPYDEQSPRTHEPNTYGGDKSLVEDLLLDAWERFRFPTTVFRPQGVFGPYDAAHAGHVFLRLLNAMPILVRKDNLARINFLYVGDFVSAIGLTIEKKLTWGKTYNIACNEPVSISQFVELCAKTTGFKAKTIALDKGAPHDLALPWLDYDLIARNDLIQRDLNLKYTRLEDALRETWLWFSNDKASNKRLSRLKHKIKEMVYRPWFKRS